MLCQAFICGLLDPFDQPVFRLAWDLQVRRSSTFVKDHMGLILLYTYLPLLIGAVFLARAAAKSLAPSDQGSKLSPVENHLLWGAGLLVGCLSTWLAIHLVEPHLNKGMEILLAMAGLSLAFPFVVGLLLGFAGSSASTVKLPRKLRLSINRAGVGSMHATWSLPVLWFVWSWIWS